MLYDLELTPHALCLRLLRRLKQTSCTVFKYQGLEFVGHGGFSRGYGSMIQMVPSRKFAVIVLTNKSGETMRKSLNKATELGLGLKDDETQKPSPVAPLTDSEMNEYVGAYSHAPTTGKSQ